MITVPLLFALMTSPNQGFDPDRLAAIPRRMKAFVDGGTVAGTVVLVLRHGKIVLTDAQGMATLSPPKPMQTDTIFQVMSMTKPVTALAVMMCVERGLVLLDDPVSKFIPGFREVKVKNPDGTLRSPKSRLTIRHLLTHTGGVGSNDPGGLDDDAKRKITLGAYAELLPTEPLIADPGEKISYSGPGFAALGRVVEVASGMPLERFLATQMFEPLGMKDTFMFLPVEKRARMAEVYVPENGKLQALEVNSYRQGAKLANPAGGLYSTAKDMATLLRCVSEGGALGGFRLVSPNTVAAMTMVQTGNLLMDGSDAQGFGLGFSVVRSPAGMNSLKPIGSFGHVGAFGTEFWTDRPRGIVVVFMSQGLGNSDEVRKTVNTMINAAFVGP